MRSRIHSALFLFTVGIIMFGFGCRKPVPPPGSAEPDKPAGSTEPAKPMDVVLKIPAMN